MNDPLQQLIEAIKVGNRKIAATATQTALDSGSSGKEVLGALSEGMDDVGKRFKANEIFVPEVLVAARAMKKSMELLEPILVKSGIKPEHTLVIGTVKGDLHDIGKNLVAMMMKGANFNVIDLGTNLPAQTILDAAIEHKADLVGLSALLTTTMPAMRETVALMNKEPHPFKIIVGGAPITQDFADDIGADGFAIDAASTVELARTLVTSS
ncbi:B12 binding domain protein [Verrucomicrobiia bacterium DG1235]|nr:B12 binding domain protein [Verrucomicrobiae bacterium DG1235]